MSAMAGAILGVLLLILVALVRIEKSIAARPTPTQYVYEHTIAMTPQEVLEIIKQLNGAELVQLYPYMEGRTMIVYRKRVPYGVSRAGNNGGDR